MKATFVFLLLGVLLVGCGDERRQAPATEAAPTPEVSDDTGETETNDTHSKIPAPNPIIEDKAWADALDSHPRIFGSGDYIRERVKIFPEKYEMIRPLTHLPPIAGIVEVVEGLSPEKIQEHINLAMANVANGPTNTHMYTYLDLDQAAVVFDFFHDYIPEKDRKSMIAWFNDHLGFYTYDETGFHAAALAKVLVYLRVAYATWGENPRAAEFRDHALVDMYGKTIAPVLNEFGNGGGFTEGGWYTRQGMWELVHALELARRIEGYDGFALAPEFFYERIAYDLSQSFPPLTEWGGERFAMEGDGNEYAGGFSDYPYFTRMILSEYYGDSELAGYNAARIEETSQSTRALVDLIFKEDPVAKLPVFSTFPLAHYASGIGRLYTRGSWEEDASWMWFECSDMWSHHQHFDVGHFEIFRHDPLATESGEYNNFLSYHDVNWLTRTIAHNSILVYQPGEVWPKMRDGGVYPYYNDGGQTKTWVWTVSVLPAWLEHKDQFDRAEVIAYEDRPEYTYIACDGTRAYAETKMEKWVRQIVFLRPHTFVILDRVAATNPDYKKTWLIHSHEEPSIVGNKIFIKRGAKGKLFVEKLLPAKADITKIEGYTYGGQVFNPDPYPDELDQSIIDNLVGNANRWRVEVSPQNGEKEEIFLFVISTDKPEYAEFTNTNGKVSVSVYGTEIQFDWETGGTVKIGKEEFVLPPAVKTGKFE